MRSKQKAGAARDPIGSEPAPEGDCDMTGRKPPSDRRRAPSASSASVGRAAAFPPILRERQAIESILRAAASEHSHALAPPADPQSAVDCLALVVRSFDSGVGLERAIAEARATLERLGREPIPPAP
jgi:hypothetical protein